MVDAGRNRGVGRWQIDDVGRFRGGAGIVFEVLGGVNVSLVRFEVDVA